MDFDDDLVAQVELYMPLPIFQRWDFFPFFIAYGIAFLSVFSVNIAMRSIAFVSIPVILLVQIVIFLFAQWSASFRVKLGCSKTYDIGKATKVLVRAQEKSGSNKIVQLNRRKENAQQPLLIGSEISILERKYSVHEEFFEFQNIKYEFNRVNERFERIRYPESGAVQAFSQSSGHNSFSSLRCLEKWGLNEFDIPVPGFLDLYLVM